MVLTPFNLDQLARCMEAMFFIYSLLSMGALLGLVGITLLTKEIVQYRKNKSQPEAEKLIPKPGKRNSNPGPPGPNPMKKFLRKIFLYSGI